MDNNQNQAQLGQNPIQPGQNQPTIGQGVLQNPIPAPQPVPQPVPTESAQSITQQPQPVSQTPENAIPPKKSHIVKTLVIMIIVAILVILGILGYIWYANNQASDTSTIQVENTTTIPTSSPVPATPEEELNSVDAGDVEVDLKEIDADLQTL